MAAIPSRITSAAARVWTTREGHLVVFVTVTVQSLVVNYAAVLKIIMQVLIFCEFWGTLTPKCMFIMGRPTTKRQLQKHVM